MTVQTAISLFASSGIGDLALDALGVKVLVANEIVPERANLFRTNFPKTSMIEGDIWEKMDEIVVTTIEKLGNEELDFLLATPPCQGMSKNGQGKLLAEIRAGRRPVLDTRNRLIIPTIEIAKRLRPRILFLENVPEMRNTIIELETGKAVNIIDFIEQEMGTDYVGKAEVIEFANFGVPQRRQRLITVFSRDENLREEFERTGKILPEPTHSEENFLGTKPWITVREVIGGLPALDGKDSETAVSSYHPLHFVPVLDPKKYWWIENTPPEKGAFDNQCVNPSCGFQGNDTHGSALSSDGINQPKVSTPIYCLECGELLPRPYTEKDGQKQLMRGFTSAYRRMKWDKPSPTLTTNLSYPSSDQNIHPSQNRVLSLLEALVLHTVTDFDYKWMVSEERPAKLGLIRDSIGESVPPRGLKVLFEHLIGRLSQGATQKLEALANSSP